MPNLSKQLLFDMAHLSRLSFVMDIIIMHQQSFFKEQAKNTFTNTQILIKIVLAYMFF